MSASSSSTSSPAQPGSAAPRCVHFGECGGCSLQHLAYEAQLAAKAGRVLALIKEAVPGACLAAVHPSPDVWHYRNKMEYSFGDVYPPSLDASGAVVPPTVKLGLKPKGRWWHILDLKECWLPSPETPALLAAVRRWAEDNKVPAYINKRKTGLLRHLVLRETKNTPAGEATERMVVLVTEAGDLPEESFVRAVLSAYPATTILRGVNTKASDTAVADSLKVLAGPGYVTETLTVRGRRLRFKISPQSFFQTNTRAAEGLYSRIAQWVEGETVLDLYCGGGGITLSLAPFAGKVIGAEQNPAAVEDAKANAVLNGLANVSFYSGDVAVLLPSLLALQPDAVVVDPPRAGLVPKVAQALAETGPRSLVYVSCNPESLARDLKILTPAYEVEQAEVFDLFPHTDHVETLVRLRRP